MMNSASRWALCLGAAIAIPATALAQAGPPTIAQGKLMQLAQSSQGQQQSSQNQQGTQNTLNQQEVRNFLNQMGQVLQQAANNRNPQQMVQFLNQNMADDATLTTTSELYLGNTLVAQTFAQLPEEALSDSMGLGGPAMHGRRILQDYSVNTNIQNIKVSQNQQHAKATVEIMESGRLSLSNLGAQAMARWQQYSGQGGGSHQAWGGQQGYQGQQGQQGFQGQQQGFQGQQGLQGQQGSGQQGFGRFSQGQMGGGQGPGQRWRQLGIGNMPDSLNFQGHAECTLNLVKENGQIQIGDTNCRAINQLS